MKKFCTIMITLLMVLSTKVEACVLTYDEYSQTGIVQSMIIGDYIFDLDNGFSPSLEDLAIAARTIPKNEDTYVYSVMNIGGYYSLYNLFEDEYSEDVDMFPNIDVTYEYRANITGASNEEYDIFTCKVDWINIKYTTLETEGEDEYKTSAVRTVNITSDNGISEVEYCITTGNDCAPTIPGEVESGILKVEYPSNIAEQRICVEAKDKVKNTSGVVCDTTKVKVDKESIKVKATEELGTIIEKQPNTIEELFEIEFSVSGGDVAYYYYLETGGKRVKYLLSNLADLPSGSIEVEARARGGNGLVTIETRIIDVVKNKVTYDYETNGGTSSEIEVYEVAYKGKAKLNAEASKPGYEFVGWNTDANAEIGLDILEVEKDTTLYAIFKKSMRAEFNIISAEGATPATSEYQAFECEVFNKNETCKVTIPSINAKMGYVVEGWSDIEYSKEAKYTGGEEVEISEDKDFYSVTRDKTATTGTFVYYTGSKVTEEVLKCYKYNGEESCKIDPSHIESKNYEGREVIGYTESATEVESVTDYNLKAGKKFYAFYEDKYTIDFVSGAGEKETDTARVYFIMNISGVKQNVADVEAPEPKEVEGYNFIGYRIGLDNGEIDAQVGDVIRVETDTQYNAIYERTVQVKYEAEADVTGIPEAITGKSYYLSGVAKEEGFTFRLDAGNTIAKTGHILSYWEYNGIRCDAGEESTTTKSIVVTPYWIINGCRIIFDYWTNGGINATKASVTYIKNDPEVDISTVKATKPGWTFIGWTTNYGAYTNPLSTVKPADTSEDLVLYAMFKKEITVDFILQDSGNFSLPVDAQTKTTIYNATKEILVNMPIAQSTNSGKEFVGWNTETNMKEVTYEGNETARISEDMVFYSVTRDKTPLKVRYYFMNEEEASVYTEKECTRYNGVATCETTAPQITIPYKTGILTGFSSESGSIVKSEKQVVSKDENYYGIYDRILTINFYSGIGAVSNTSRNVNMQYLVNLYGVSEYKASIEMEDLDGISGYSSLGWRDDEIAGIAEFMSGATIQVNDDKNFYGVYSKQVTVSYAAMGGSTTPSNQTNTMYYNTVDDIDNVSTTFTLAGGVWRKGYWFRGWNLNNTGDVYSAYSTITLKESAKMYAVWSGQSYTVTYDYATNGGESSSKTTASVVYLNQVDLSPVAAKAGWEFVGWSEEEGSTTVLTQKDMPAEDLTLYAVYRKAITGTWVMTDTNAGTLEADTTECYKYNNETSCKINTGNVIAKAGYVASGWTSSQGSTTAEAGNNATMTVDEDKVYYSITRKSDPIIGIFYYGTEENTIVSTTSTCQLYNGATECTISAPLIPTEYKDAIFEKWSSSATEVVEIESYTISKATTYYSNYVKPIDIIYHDGLEDTQSTDTKTVEYILSDLGDNEKVPTFEIRTPIEESGWNILGWTDDGTSQGDIKFTGGTTEILNYTVELYARYNREISVEYDAQGGSPTPATQTAIQDYHSVLGATRHTFELAGGLTVTKSGFRFAGWYDASSGGTKYTELILQDSLKLYAQWENITYTVTFNGQGGTISSGSDWIGSGTTATKDVEFESTYGRLPTPTRSGYTFNGWFTETIGGTQITENTTVTLMSDQSLYAQWTANTYTVTFDAAGGSYEKVIPDGTAVLFNPNTNSICTTLSSSATGTKSGCMQWYTFLDDPSSDTIRLILDHNTTGSVAWNSNSTGTTPTTVTNQLTTDISGWNDSVKSTARLITASELNEIAPRTDEIAFNVNDEDTYYFLHTGNRDQFVASNDTRVNKYYWLINNTIGCLDYGCTQADSGTYGYWTSDYAESAKAWRINLGGALTAETVTTTFGVRPVIEIDRSLVATGSTETKTKTVTYDGEYGTLTDVSRLGYTFEGWYTDSGTKITETSIVKIASDHTLTARWTPKQYTVTFDYNEPNLYSTGTAIYFNPVTATTCSEEDAVSTTGTKTGCMKWYAFLDSESSSTLNLLLDHNTTGLVVGSDVATQLASDTSGWNATVKASARLITASEVGQITGNASFNNSSSYTSYYFFENYTQTAPAPYSGKYCMLYENLYNTSASGCTAEDNNTYTGSETNNLYGYWTGTTVADDSTKTWNVRRDGKIYINATSNGRLNGIRPVISISKELLKKEKTTKTITFGSAYGELPTPETDGYVFTGWQTESGDIVTADTIVTIAKNHTLYAQWGTGEYKLTFDGNGVTGTPETTTVIYGETYGNLPSYVMKNYEFLGWYTDPVGGTKILPDTIVTIGKDHTLYAHWLLRTPSNMILYHNTPKLSSEIDFSKSSQTTGDVGLYQWETKPNIYFFRGAVTNNNVIFANKCWRIVRTNDDGSIRLMYYGTPTSGTCPAIGSQVPAISAKFNTSPSYNAYVGYMYGTAGSKTYAKEHANTNSSNAKTQLENWYKTNILSYASSVANSVFCNDRSMKTGTVDGVTWHAYGYGTNQTMYGPRYRITYDTANKTWGNGTASPTFECTNADDKFTASGGAGNNKLTYPVGLITADEAAFAGGAYDTTNSTFYMAYSTTNSATMSPSVHTGSAAQFLNIRPDGEIAGNDVSYTNFAMFPVISINSDVIFANGDGSNSTPYTIE